MYSNTFARSGSNGSIDMASPSSSGRNTDNSITDEEDSQEDKSSVCYKERRREAHTQAEQKRRDAIKRGYEDLQGLVPTCQQQDQVSSYKLSKATILQRSIDYIQFLQQQKKKHDDKLQCLRKEVVALQIMRSNYEQIVKHHKQTQSIGHNSNHLSDEIKFQVFQAICDSLYHTFDKSVEVESFSRISACIFSWLEEHCKPQTLSEMVAGILNQLKAQIA